MSGLLRKIFYEVRMPVLLFAIGLAAIMSLLTALLPQVLGDVDKLFESISFIKPLISALLGVDVGDGLTAQMMQAFLWVHPTVLAMIWAHELMYCSRVPAAEIDRGTIDFLLGLPVSRWRLFFAETIGWLVSGVFMLVTGWLGHAVASRWLEPDMQPSAFATFCVMANLFAVFVAVGGMTFLISANSDRRGRTIGIAFAILLFSFLLNFLAQFWEPAKSVSFLSIMSYYQPAKVLEAEAFPVGNVLILATLGLICWSLAGLVFRRRSICTV